MVQYRILFAKLSMGTPPSHDGIYGNTEPRRKVITVERTVLMVVVVVVIRQQQNESNRISLRTMMVRLVVVRRMINFVGRNDLLPEI